MNCQERKGQIGGRGRAGVARAKPGNQLVIIYTCTSGLMYYHFVSVFKSTQSFLSVVCLYLLCGYLPYFTNFCSISKLLQITFSYCSLCNLCVII